MKRILVLLSLMILVSTVNVAAETIKYITDSTVNFRSGPGTGYDSLGVFSAGDKVTLLNVTVAIGTGCTEGWLNIAYNGQNGYVCSKYVTDQAPVATYGRPWTTPKKAIVGGAQFIAQSYINKGQFSSYLQKFNVNPSGSYSVHNHQYMTNIRAPYTEAKKSYDGLKNTAVFNLPLVFSIPIYNNMPSATSLSGYTASNTGRAHNGGSDYDFDNLLDSWGWSQLKNSNPDLYETYVSKLRALHDTNAAWIFYPMYTGLDFNSAVESQKRVGAIDSSAYYDASMSWVEGSNWYMPSAEATAYFLDPRNFFSVERIWQFEKLDYSAVYTEAMIALILAGSHMDGFSLLDNQTYASIFVEAGQVAGINAAHLASRALVETGSGAKGSVSTTGKEFTLDGVTYSGIFNYFNIGAGSGNNAVYKGLVWASTGINDIISSEELRVLSLLNVNKASNYIMGIEFNTTLGSIKNNAGASITIDSVSYAGEVQYDDWVLGTGSLITVKDGETIYQYTVVMYGDITGDGVSNSADLLKVRQHLLGTSTLNNSFYAAADVNKDNQINSADLLKIRRCLLGLEAITQK